MHVILATHGHGCRGLAPAVVFARLPGQITPRSATFPYRGCDRGIGQRLPDGLLSGDENVVLDHPVPIEQLHRARRAERAIATALAG